PDLVGDKSVVLVDEAIISGATQRVCINKLKDAKAREIHVRIPAPMMFAQCGYRVLDGKAYLLARELQDGAGSQLPLRDLEQAMAKELDVSSVRFLSLDGFLQPL